MILHIAREMCYQLAAGSRGQGLRESRKARQIDGEASWHGPIVLHISWEVQYPLRNLFAAKSLLNMRIFMACSISTGCWMLLDVITAKLLINCSRITSIDTFCFSPDVGPSLAVRSWSLEIHPGRGRPCCAWSRSFAGVPCPKRWLFVVPTWPRNDSQKPPRENRKVIFQGFIGWRRVAPKFRQWPTWVQNRWLKWGSKISCFGRPSLLRFLLKLLKDHVVFLHFFGFFGSKLGHWL